MIYIIMSQRSPVPEKRPVNWNTSQSMPYVPGRRYQTQMYFRGGRTIQINMQDKENIHKKSGKYQAKKPEKEPGIGVYGRNKKESICPMYVS